MRHIAADALERIGTPAVTALIEAISSDKHWVRQKATVALMEIGDARAVPALSAALRDDDNCMGE